MADERIPSIVTIVIVVSMMVLAFALAFVYLRIERIGDTDIAIIIVFVNARYSESTGILTVNLQYFGDSLHSVTKEDFDCHINNQKVDSICLIPLLDKDNMDSKDGKPIEIMFETENIPSGAKIVLIYKSTIQIFIEEGKIIRY